MKKKKKKRKGRSKVNSLTFYTNIVKYQLKNITGIPINKIYMQLTQPEFHLFCILFLSNEKVFNLTNEIIQCHL